MSKQTLSEFDREDVKLAIQMRANYIETKTVTFSRADLEGPHPPPNIKLSRLDESQVDFVKRLRHIADNLDQYLK